MINETTLQNLINHIYQNEGKVKNPWLIPPSLWNALIKK